MSISISEIYKILPLTPEEIRRLKIYASDPYYTVYIGMKNDIVQTIDRAKKAISQANQAISISNYAKSVASSAQQLANKAKSVADDAWRRASDALSQVQQAFDKLSELESSISSLWDKANKLGSMLNNAGKNFSSAAQKIRSDINDMISKINNISSEIKGINSKIQTEVNNIKTYINNIKSIIGSARVDFSKLDGDSSYTNRGNTASGLIGDIAWAGWDLGQVGWNLNNLIEEREFTIDLGSLGKYGFTVPVPRPDRVLKAAQFLYDFFNTPLPHAMSHIRGLSDNINKAFASMHKIVGYIGEAMSKATTITSIITSTMISIFNTIASLFTYIYEQFVPPTTPPTPPSFTPTTVPGFTPPTPPSIYHSKGSFVPPTISTIEALKLVFDEKIGTLKDLVKGETTIHIGGQISPY